MHHQGFSFSLRELIAKSLNSYGLKGAKQISEIADMVYKFLQNRLTHQLTEEGFSKDVIAAVADVSADNLTNVWNRVRALQDLKTAPDFEPLAIAFKRVVNIIKKADLPARKDIDTSLFENESESALYKAYKAANNKVAGLMEKGRLDQALREIASLRDSVDAFFDGVMVMAEDKKIRNNRLALLGLIADLFGLFADFSKIST
jgi:glycyl-tRNA synthetase beta chain